MNDNDFSLIIKSFVEANPVQYQNPNHGKLRIMKKQRNGFRRNNLKGQIFRSRYEKLNPL